LAAPAARAQEDVPAAPTTSVQGQDLDLALLRRFLRRQLVTSHPFTVLPVSITQALDRLVGKDSGRGHAWNTLKVFLEASAKVSAQRMAERRMRPNLCGGYSKPPRWLCMTMGLLNYADQESLSMAKYLKARRDLEEELLKAIAQTEVDGAKPFSRTVEETARLVLTLLEPDVKDPKTQPSPLREEIGSLVSLLGSADFQTSKTAMKRLRAIGEPALGALRDILEDKDPEIADRAQDIWFHILKDTARTPLHLKDLKTLPYPLRGEIVGLIGRLGDPDFKIRETTTVRLRAIGEPALGALRDILKDKDPEIADRAQTLWRDILEDAVLDPPNQEENP